MLFFDKSQYIKAYAMVMTIYLLFFFNFDFAVALNFETFFSIDFIAVLSDINEEEMQDHVKLSYCYFKLS